MPLTTVGMGSLAASRIVGTTSIKVQEAVARLGVGFDPGRPAHDHRVARAAEVGGDLLDPLEGRVAGPGPADRIVRLGLGSAEFVKVSQHDLPIVGVMPLRSMISFSVPSGPPSAEAPLSPTM